MKILSFLRLALLAIFAMLALAAQAQSTYRWTDPQTGQVVFSDKPPPAGVKQVSRFKSGAVADDDNAGLPYASRQAAQNFPVVLYTSHDCLEVCRQARDALNSRGIPFRERLLSTPEDFAELKPLSGGELRVPLLTVGREVSKGFDAGIWNNLLDLAGYPKTAPYGSKPRGGLEK